MSRVFHHFFFFFVISGQISFKTTFSLFSFSSLGVCVCAPIFFFPLSLIVLFFLFPPSAVLTSFFVTYPFPDSCFLCSCLALKHAHILGHTHAREQTHTHTQLARWLSDWSNNALFTLKDFQHSSCLPSSLPLKLVYFPFISPFVHYFSFPFPLFPFYCLSFSILFVRV